ncbi:MAG: hypothetical protein H0W87_02970 [Actinobacteria bacterium]|nr:hypothetical protein [Actinomycetota bacterium]
MNVEITPAPSEEEREAIETALRGLVAGAATHPAYASAWRQAGIREAAEGQAVARLRSSFGAARA